MVVSQFAISALKRDIPEEAESSRVLLLSIEALDTMHVV